MNTLVLNALPTLLGLLGKGTLLLLAAWGTCLFLRRASAALRHAVWAAALAGFLLLPLLSFALPHWNVAWWSTAAIPKATQPFNLPMSPATLTPTGSSAKSIPVPDTSAPSENMPPVSATAVPAQPVTIRQRSRVFLTSRRIIDAGIAVWWTGFLLVLVQFCIGIIRIRQVQAKAVPLEDAVLRIAEAACQKMGIRRRVEFLQASDGSGVAVPVTWGFFRPVVLLTSQSTAWSEECLRAALLHELAHVQRWDWPTYLLSRLACALYWWHPLVWMAARQARAESERACDDLALGTGMTAADYAQRLLEVVRSMPTGTSPRSSVIAMAQPSEVERRVKDVLMQRDRRPISPRKLAAGLLFAGAGVAALSSLHLLAHAQAANTSVPNLTESAYGTDAIPGSSRATLPNGYAVSLVAVTQALRDGDEWDMYGGPWWRSDGKPALPQSGGMNGHLHWRAAQTHGLAPYVFKIAVRPPGSNGQRGASDGMNFFCQFLGALRAPGEMEGRIMTKVLKRAVPSTPVSLVDDSAPHLYNHPLSGTLPAELYLDGTRTCTVRCGVAVGPWQTSTARSSGTPASGTARNPASAFTTVSLTLQGTPKVTCRDARGRTRVFSFDKSLGRLSDVGWRLGAVDTAGRVVPMFQIFTLAPGETVVRYFIEPSAMGMFENGKAQGLFLAPPDTLGTFTWTTSVDATKVSAFRLETRPYQTVEFHNVQLSPAADVSGSTPSSTMLVEQARGVQFAQARALRAHLQPWAQSSKALLLKMAHSQPADLSALMGVYDSLQRLPNPLWSGDPRLHRGDDDPSFSFGLPSRLTLSHLQRSQDSVETQMRRDFAQRRDFRVTESEAVGGQQITLWASGRITQNILSKTSSLDNQQEIVLAFTGENGTSDLAEGASSLVGSDPLHPPQEQLPKIVYGFRRYTSTPLPDGTRFTFLYPSYWNHIGSDHKKNSQEYGKANDEYWSASLEGSEQPVRWAAARGQTPIPYLFRGPYGILHQPIYDDFCSVVVGHAGNVRFPTGADTLRKETQWAGKNISHHTLSIIDKRAHLRFLVNYENRDVPDLFRQVDPVIFRSFRILPPLHPAQH